VRTGPRKGTSRQAPYRMRSAEAYEVEAARLTDPHPYCIFTYEHCSECPRQTCTHRGCKT
jgi:hypothetical protein